MHKKAIAFAVLILFALSAMACTPAQQVKPETVPQKIVYAYGLIDGIAGTVDNLYRAGVLNRKETTDAVRTLENAWKMLNEAEKLYSDGNGQYELNIENAMKVLGALQAFTLERSKK